MKFRETLIELDQISKQLKDQGIIVEKLDRAIADLKEHQGNIEKIEDNIDAIKQEVIAPIHTELDQNRIAGKFSIFGFWVGALGLVVSIGTIFFQQATSPQSSASTPTSPSSKTSAPSQQSFRTDVSNAEIVRKLELIERQLLFPRDIKAKDGEIFVAVFEREMLASAGEKSIYLEASSIHYEKDEGLKVGIKLFLESNQGTDEYQAKQQPKVRVRSISKSNQLGPATLAKALSRSDGKAGFRSWHDDNATALVKGDSLMISDVKIEVVEILSQAPYGRLIGDAKTGVLLKVRVGNVEHNPASQPTPASGRG